MPSEEIAAIVLRRLGFQHDDDDVPTVLDDDDCSSTSLLSFERPWYNRKGVGDNDDCGFGIVGNPRR